jgi:flagellar biosynthetic protein FlhB
MANSDGQERTEAPTPRRRDEARKEGRVPRSQELSGAVLLLAGTTALALAGGASLARQAMALLRGASIAWLTADPMTPANAVSLIEEVMRTTLLALVPFLAGVAGISLLVNAMQARGVISTEPLVPKLSHVDPIAGLGRLFSVDAVFNVLKGVAKFAVISAVAWMVLRRAWPEILSTSGAPVPQILGTTRALAVRMALMVGLVYLAIAAADYGFQLWQYEKSLRMTKQEIVQEHRESEGDPQVKGRIRQLQKAMARKRMLTSVATADVVVTNPTRIAVALKYDPLVAAAPVVIAMGERLLAKRIRELAQRAGVPIVENKPLARALLANAKVGQPIPAALYVAVAEVIAFVMKLKGAMLPARRPS